MAKYSISAIFFCVYAYGYMCVCGLLHSVSVLKGSCACGDFCTVCECAYGYVYMGYSCIVCVCACGCLCVYVCGLIHSVCVGTQGQCMYVCVFMGACVCATPAQCVCAYGCMYMYEGLMHSVCVYGCMGVCVGGDSGTMCESVYGCMRVRGLRHSV